MKLVLFCHSLISDWNHGNAHFLRGVCSELVRRGHDVTVYEPRDAWSLRNLVRSEGASRLTRIQAELHRHYPRVESHRYDVDGLDTDAALEGADVVLVHEWTDAEVVRRIGRHRLQGGGYRLFFHDTHHRSVTDPLAMESLRLDGYDGVLAFGDPVREIYDRWGWGGRAWTWHEAADVRIFRPLPDEELEGDLVWIGNWGDAERTRALHRYLLRPVAELGLRAAIHGVRYPQKALTALHEAGAEYRGWLPNYHVPRTFARFRATVHVPRAPYLGRLRSIPTIRPFEAMACGVPMVTAEWDDPAGMFRAGEDFLVASDEAEMRAHLRVLMQDDALRAAIGRSGRRTIMARHTCAHRVDELIGIVQALEPAELEEPVPADPVPVRPPGTEPLPHPSFIPAATEGA